MVLRCKNVTTFLVLKWLPPLDCRLARNGGQGSIEETEIFILRWDFLGFGVVSGRAIFRGGSGKRGTCACSLGKGDSGTECRREWEKGNNCGAPGKGSKEGGLGNRGQGSIEESEIFILRWGKLGSDLVRERRFSVGTGGQRGTWCRWAGPRARALLLRYCR